MDPVPQFEETKNPASPSDGSGNNQLDRFKGRKSPVVDQAQRTDKITKALIDMYEAEREQKLGIAEPKAIA
jgi:hypothetical protein